MPPTTVMFGEVEASSVTFNDTGEVVATTPTGAAAGSVDVTVTTSGGSATLADGFEYTDA